MTVQRLFPALLLLLFTTLSIARTTGCHDAQLLGPKLLTDICWDCLFPIRLGTWPLINEGRIPNGAYDGATPFCECVNDASLPVYGFISGMWEPSRLVEFQRVPGCASVLGGERFPFDRVFQGHHGEGEHDGSDESFMHYHYYAFPLLAMLDLFIKRECSSDGYLELDLMYLSEVDPTWNNDELAFFTNPEVAAVANPVAAMACIPDALASTAKRPVNSLFWCAGTWGTIYPLSGHQTGGGGVIRDSSLLTARVLAALHRRGLARKTMGEDALCRSEIHPMLPKSQYKFTMLYPVPETSSDHVMGESILRWGLGRTIPGREDPVYTIWKWNDCCLR